MSKCMIYFCLMLLIVALASPVTRAGIVAEYVMNEGSGTSIVDSSGNGNDGTFMGSGTGWSAGVYGDCIQFNGGGFVQVPDSPSLDSTTSQISVAAWINTTDTGQQQDIAIWKIGAYVLNHYSDDNLYFGLTQSTGDVYDWFPVVYGTWQHVAFTYDGANIRGYLNGVLQSTTPATGAISTSDNPLQIGRDNTGTHYVGLMDNVRIYDNALDLAGVLNDMHTAHSIVQERQTSAGRLFGMDGDSIAVSTDPADPTKNFIPASNTGGDPNKISFLVDMGSARILDYVQITNRNATTNLAPTVMSIYTAADESDPNFNPWDVVEYTELIGSGALDPSTNAANAVRSLNANNAVARYIMIEITENFFGSINNTTNKYCHLQDVAIIEERLVSAGRLLGIGGDSAAVGVDPTDPNYQLVIQQYNYPDIINEDGTIDAVIDMGSVKEVMEFIVTNRFTTPTNYSPRNINIYVTPDVNIPGSEFNPGFDPLNQDNYSVLIYSGIPEPSGNAAGAVRTADVNDVARRYLRISVSSNYRDIIVLFDNELLQLGDYDVLTGEVISCSDVIRLGFGLDGDLTDDCRVGIADIEKLSSQWLQCTNPQDADCMRSPDALNSSKIIPVPGGGITVDGSLSDWTGPVEWIPFDRIYAGAPAPTDVSQAEFALRWDSATDKIYAAVRVVDGEHNFENSPVSYTSSDRLEIYAQGDAAGGTGWGTSGSGCFDVAQQYIVGPNTSGGRWAVWGDLATNINANAGFESAVSVNGDTIVYELGVKQFDNYGGICGTTAESALGLGSIVGFDLLVVTKHNGTYSYLSENLWTGKSADADQFRQYLLTDQSFCGDWGYLVSDISGDCKVSLSDFVDVAIQWLSCNDPQDDNCQHNW